MKLAPSATHTPRHPALAALAAAAALSLTSCTTCPFCCGAGLQVVTPSGAILPYVSGTPNLKIKVRPKIIACKYCEGQGEIPLYAQPQTKRLVEQQEELNKKIIAAQYPLPPAGKEKP